MTATLFLDAFTSAAKKRVSVLEQSSLKRKAVALTTALICI